MYRFPSSLKRIYFLSHSPWLSSQENCDTFFFILKSHTFPVHLFTPPRHFSFSFSPVRTSPIPPNAAQPTSPATPYPSFFFAPTLLLFVPFSVSFSPPRFYQRLFQFTSYTLSLIRQTARSHSLSHFLPSPHQYPSSFACYT